MEMACMVMVNGGKEWGSWLVTGGQVMGSTMVDGKWAALMVVVHADDKLKGSKKVTSMKEVELSHVIHLVRVDLRHPGSSADTGTAIVGPGKVHDPPGLDDRDISVDGLAMRYNTPDTDDRSFLADGEVAAGSSSLRSSSSEVACVGDSFEPLFGL
ncbi:hypothetical protein Dimus_018712 [Dionaea muscipula]